MRGLIHRAGRLFVLAVGALLGGLHLAVLARRVADGTLFEPLVIAQWLLAAGLMAAAFWLRRSGVDVFRGRPAAVFWIVVALMHGVVALPAAPGFVGVLGALPVSSALPVGAGLALGALALAAAAAVRRASSEPRLLEMLLPAVGGLPWTRRPTPLTARAPPA